MSGKNKKLINNFLVAVAIILIWRGIWYIMDFIDLKFFGGSHAWTALLGIIAGVIILYIPDKNLNELGKL